MRASGSSFPIPFICSDGGGGDDSESKRVCRRHLREFDFGGQLSAMEKPTHLAICASHASERGFIFRSSHSTQAKYFGLDTDTHANYTCTLSYHIKLNGHSPN